MRPVWKWAFIGAALGGIAIPVLTEAFYMGTGTLAGPEVLLVWPSSIALMGLEAHHPATYAMKTWAFALIPNAVLYGSGFALASVIATKLAGSPPQR